MQIELQELCDILDIQKEVREAVLELDCQVDYAAVAEHLQGLLEEETSKQAWEALKTQLGEDDRGYKILTCMLNCIKETYARYRMKGIPREIFIDTMKCFPRFLEEHYNSYGKYAFDRDWWTYRQISMELFRIGVLEYEFGNMDGEKVVKIHIPSDAVLTPEKCGESIYKAKQFIEHYYPEYMGRIYVCNSWLLSPSLEVILPPGSNIIKFRNCFEIIAWDKDDNEFIEWVFGRADVPLQELQENTSLQRSMKKYLLKGEKVGAAIGILKKQHRNGEQNAIIVRNRKSGKD